MELRLILGDQLNAGHSWFRTPDPAVCYLMAELRQETDYCRHHRQKVLAFLPPCAPSPPLTHQGGPPGLLPDSR